MPSPSELARQDEDYEGTYDNTTPIGNGATTLDWLRHERERLILEAKAYKDEISYLREALAQAEDYGTQKFLEVEALTKATAIHGEAYFRALEDRDRTLAENCRMTEINRALKAYFEAAEDEDQASIDAAEAMVSDEIQEAQRRSSDAYWRKIEARGRYFKALEVK